jgi:alpha-ketoglutarate-dependent 2,4-dichlorophenoxyacetate dioxygenase
MRILTQHTWITLGITLGLPGIGASLNMPSHHAKEGARAMPVQIRQIGPSTPTGCFAGEVGGVDMRRPLSQDEVAAIHAGMDKYAVLVFRGQAIDDAQQLAFTVSLGEIEHAIGTSLRAANELRLPTTFADVSNLDKDQKPFARDDRRRLFGIGNRLWHSDSSFKVVPAKYSLLHARSVTSTGGNTEFADMRAAYDALDAETREIVAPLVCEHSQIYSRGKLGFTDFTAEETARFAPVRQRLVRTHPVTGRKSLYLSSHAGGIVGWSLPEARALLMDLNEAATQREFVYAHKWRVGDLIMWDNRQTMHRARPFPAHEPRDMRRTTLAGDGPTAEQAAA